MANLVGSIIQKIKNIFIVLLDDERKPLVKVAREFIILSLKEKGIASHYFSNFLYKNDIKNYLDFLSNKEWEYRQRVICDDDTAELTGNKLLFHEYYNKTGIPIPKLLAYNIRDKIIICESNKWCNYDISTSEDMINLMEKIVNSSTSKSVFIKPIRGTGGESTKKISDKSLIATNEFARELKSFIIANSFIFQEEIQQHQKLQMLNSACLNTVRIDTFRQPNSIPEIISAYLRVGRSGCQADNLELGSLSVSINMDNGALRQKAYGKIKTGNRAYLKHPDTQVAFNQFALPYFKELKKYTIEAASWLPKALVGWDFGIAEDGPVLIECNALYYGKTCDVRFGGYRKNTVYCKVIDYVKRYK